MLKLTRWAAPVAALILLAGCSGNTALTGTAALPEEVPGDLAAAGPLGLSAPVAKAPPASGAGLPTLAGLQSLRTTSVSGPGWYPVSVLHASHSAGTSIAGGTQLQLDGGLGLAYAVYAVDGFDGDCFPTSLKVSLSAATGEYFVGFSDFTRGTWRFSGPFNASAEVEIPLLDDYTSATAYASHAGVHYFAVLADPPAQLTLAQLELGVDGGSAGPQPVSGGAAAGGDAGCMAFWMPSLSQWDPDFAGYELQRAPLLSGDFATLGSVPLSQTNYFDATAISGTSYRWRISALDVSGNRSAWTPFSGGGTAGDNVPPIPVVDMPVGKLYAPREITFDLSSSFDPEGDPITDYIVTIAGALPTAISPTPEITVNLGPGCYMVMVGAKSGADVGIAYYRLKLYPQWEAAPTVVREPLTDVGSSLAQFYAMSMHYSEPDERLVAAGYDFTRQQFCIIDSGMEHCFPGYAIPLLSGEAIESGDSICFPFVTAHAVLLLSWTPAAAPGQGSGSLRQVYPDSLNINDPLGANFVAAARDAAGHVWVLYAREEGGLLNLYAQAVDGISALEMLVPNIGALDALDAEFNPATGNIEIVASDSSGLYWFDFDPATATASAPVSIDALGAIAADMEISPLTNRAVLLYMRSATDRFLYTERDALGIWSAGVLVDNASANWRPADLEFAGGTPYALFARDDSQGRLYSLNTLGGTLRNAPADFSTTGYQALLQPAGGAELLAAWRAADGHYLFRRLAEDGTDSASGDITSTEGQGYQLQLASSADGLHATWGALLSGIWRHSLSADGGASWLPQPDMPFVTNVALAANELGELYMSCTAYAANLQQLWVWDSGTSSWVNQGLDTDNNLTSAHALLAGSYLDEGIVWLRYDTTAADLTYSNGSAGGLYSTASFASDLEPLWDGAVLAPTGFLITSPFTGLTVGGGSAPSSGYVAYYWDATAPSWLYPPVGRAPHDLLTSSMTAGANFGAAYYIGELNWINNQEVYYATHGELLAPIRYRSSPPPEYSDIALPASWAEFYERDLRRTVSAMTAQGVTAVAVICSLDGREQYLEWSNFGQFEQLPLPAIGAGTRAVLACGADKRWYMVYLDPLTDRIMCLRTL